MRIGMSVAAVVDGDPRRTRAMIGGERIGSRRTRGRMWTAGGQASRRFVPAFILSNMKNALLTIQQQPDRRPGDRDDRSQVSQSQRPILTPSTPATDLFAITSAAPQSTGANDVPLKPRGASPPRAPRMDRRANQQAAAARAAQAAAGGGGSGSGGGAGSGGSGVGGGPGASLRSRISDNKEGVYRFNG